jgi:hypothetical protein
LPACISAAPAETPQALRTGKFPLPAGVEGESLVLERTSTAERRNGFLLPANVELRQRSQARGHIIIKKVKFFLDPEVSVLYALF